LISPREYYIIKLKELFLCAGGLSTVNSRGHFWVSTAKSVIRLFGVALTLVTKSVVVLAVAFGVAELLGIVEELVDKR
jgi:hypothetical protein